MDIRKIKKLIELLEESSLSEIEIVEGEESVRLSRSGMAGAGQLQAALPPAVQAAAWAAPGSADSATQAAAAGTPPPADEVQEEESVPEGELVRAPMVGTFYASPSPEADVYVSLPSPMASRAAGTLGQDVVEALTAHPDGQPVEFDQPLFVIR